MHSTASRLQNVFGFFTTVSFFVAVLAALSVLLYPTTPTATVDIVNVKVIKGRANYYSKQQEYAFITFDLDADLSSLYNWNTKQVFCWLSVVYGGAGRATKHTDNEIIIWDAILPNPQASRPKSRSAQGSRLSLRNEKAKYNVNDIAGRFLERNATVRFGWNVQPHVGALKWGSVEVEEGVKEVELGELEKGRGKRGEGWEFMFPVVGAKKKPVVPVASEGRTRRASA